MTFNKMRFPIVWITLALCVVLCAIEVSSGPVDRGQELSLVSKDYTSRSGRQEPYDEDSDEENDDGSDEESDDDAGEGDDDDTEDEERSLKRNIREASQKPLLFNDQSDEESIIPITDAPSTEAPTKKPSSVLLLLSTALDKAIAATTKLPTQQMASDAASVFLLLGQVFSEAIDKVIGEDGPEEGGVTEIGVTDATEIPAEELTQLAIDGIPEKVEKQPEIDSSQSGMKFPSS